MSGRSHKGPVVSLVLSGLLGVFVGVGLDLLNFGEREAQAARLNDCPAGCEPGRVCFEQSCVPAPMRCAAKCEQRMGDGSCQQFAPDTCGPAMRCAAPCIAREANGDCREWTPDVCGPEMACVPRCESRGADGRCQRYDEDLCGARASCAKNCVNRGADGSCRLYAEDACASAD